MNNIICVSGPTASGKTALAVELAKEFNGEVVSCDSMYVYKRMNIGTAKPTLEEMDGIVHHMIDVAEPWEDFSVSKYCDMAAPIVDDIVARGKTALIAGGTGLYMDSLIKGNDFAPFPATGHRQRLEEKLARVGLDALLAELAAVDPEAADRVFHSGADITMVGLDVTHQCLIGTAATRSWREAATSRPANTMAKITPPGSFSSSGSSGVSSTGS